MDTIELQEREQKRLCDSGFHFTVTRNVSRREKGIRGLFFKKRTADEETITYKVLQPTLATLDRMAPHMMQLSKYEDIIRETPYERLLDVSKTTVKESRTMAKILAIVVMGEDYYIFDGGKYKTDDKGLEEIEDIMYRHINPSRLFSICEAVLSVCNLGDFTNSIRLMAAETESVAVSPREGRVE